MGLLPYDASRSAFIITIGPGIIAVGNVTPAAVSRHITIRLSVLTIGYALPRYLVTLATTLTGLLVATSPASADPPLVEKSDDFPMQVQVTPCSSPSELVSIDGTMHIAREVDND